MQVRPFTWLALSFFGYYCAYGVFLPLFPAWLKTQSYSEESIGLLLACAYIFRFSGGILFSGLIKRVSLLVNGLRYLGVASAITMALIGLMSHNFWLLFIGLALYSMVNAAGMPIGDSLASTWQQQIHLDYGKARLIGSFAFVVGVMVFGYFVGLVGEQYITWMITGILVFYCIVQLLHPNPMPQDEPQSGVENSVGFLDLLKNKTTLRLFIAISLIQGSHAAYYSYSTIFWTNHGHSVSDAGLFWGISVLAEIVVFFFSTRLFKNWTITALFYLTGIAAIVRWLAFGYADTFVEIVLLQCFHSLTYVVGHYATVRYITTQPQTHIAKLQGLYNALAGCAAIAIFTALSGVLYPISPVYTFSLMAAFAFIGLFITPRGVKAFLVHRV